MPHQCTNCGKVFPDGSKEMLSGCPNCGGNKFQFRPSGSAGSTDGAASSTRTEGTDRSSPSSTSTPTDAERSPAADRAQSDADSTRRSDTASTDSQSAGPETGGSASETSAGRRTQSEDAKSPTWARTAERAADVEDDDRPASNAPDEATRDASPDAAEGGGGLSGRANRAGKSVRDWVNSRGTDPSQEEESASASASASSAKSESESPEAGDSPRTPAERSPQAQEQGRPKTPEDAPARGEPESDREDSAQASARSAVVSPDEIAAAADRAAVEEADGPPTDADGTVIEPQSDERPELDELREELNSQFESIKIVAPGEYELNLMELYDRTEYIISLREDGRYVIEVPDSWDGEPDE
ncbi:OapC/ArvC family zinc-ribbon domain-containing protein [Halopelagius fulvigenes]|uniref:Zn-ribbon containing protein n=1 Tax=Halopelagius fulvigenes TaxID=1198324 RepID=A0ABD5U2R4_9EURY